MAAADAGRGDDELFIDMSAVDITKFKLPEVSLTKDALPSNEEDEDVMIKV